MGFDNKYPYTDFHELNLDWFLQEFNKLLKEWADLAADNAEFKQTMTERFRTLSDTVHEFTTFVTNYFDNLDVQQEINNKLNDMVEDGTLSELLRPYFNMFTVEINARMNNQDDRISVLEGRMDTFTHLTDGSTSGDAELQDIRVGANGVTYPTAGDAVRGQVIDLETKINANDEKEDAILSSSFNITKGTLFDSYNSSNVSDIIIANAPFILLHNEDIVGKIISEIKLNVKTAGSFSIGYSNTLPANGDPYDPDVITITEVLDIQKTGVQIVKLTKPFVFPENCWFVVGMTTDTCVFKYGTSGATTGLSYVNHDDNKYVVRTSGSINIDIIGYNVKDYYNFDDVERKFNGLYDEIGIENMIAVDGYSDENPAAGNFATSPFVLVKDNIIDMLIKSMTIKIRSTGTITVGTIKRSDADVGDAYDISKLNIYETINVKTIGTQTINLNKYIYLKPDEYLFFGIPGDTATFSFGGYGNDKGFRYVSNEKYTNSNNSAGATFNAFSYKLNESIYKGKKLSILGDSISTFSGYIPEGNLSYYPAGDVLNVSDTWWYKLYNALEMTVDTNNSWSGSKVTTTGGSESAGCGDRCENLGNPDVIIVWMGINDFNSEVALGTYDGTSEIPTVTTTFREAYAIMLNKILTKYQTAEVWVCTLPQCERNASTGFPEINQNGVALKEFNDAIKELAAAFGVRILDHNASGLTYQNMPTFNPDNLHPNKKGHSVIANNDIRQLDNYVRIRYDI